MYHVCFCGIEDTVIVSNNQKTEEIGDVGCDRGILQGTALGALLFRPVIPRLLITNSLTSVLLFIANSVPHTDHWLLTARRVLPLLGCFISFEYNQPLPFFVDKSSQERILFSTKRVPVSRHVGWHHT